jgi:hypothetical protein
VLGIEPKGLMHIKQAFYHWAISQAEVCLFPFNYLRKPGTLFLEEF